MDRYNIWAFMRESASYEDLQAVIVFAQEEINRRKEAKREKCQQAIIDALKKATDAGFRIRISDEDTSITYDDLFDIIELL